jgi:uncharacterized membrane protein YfcA
MNRFQLSRCLTIACMLFCVWITIFAGGIREQAVRQIVFKQVHWLMPIMIVSFTVGYGGKRNIKNHLILLFIYMLIIITSAELMGDGN